MTVEYAEVVVDTPHAGSDRMFHYLVPPALTDQVKPGIRVWVPFGPRNVAGVVVALADSASVAQPKEIKQILEPEPIFDPVMLELARWIAEYYLCPLSKVLKCFLPTGLKAKSQEVISLGLTTEEELAAAVAYWQTLDPRVAKLLTWLGENGETPVNKLGRLLPAAGKKDLLVDLVDRGLITSQSYAVTPKQRERKGETAEPAALADPKPLLTVEQAKALNQIVDALDRSQYQVLNLHGVTGSGKTEIYLRAIEHLLPSGRQAIVLVPEISLTPQIIAQFHRRFGSQVAVLHSRLTTAERRQEWLKIQTGQVTIAVGARSAVFAPFKKLGLIIIDEEHETSYKQEDQPRYHARDVARKRAELADIVLILGSATPSVETCQASAEGRYGLISLAERVEARPLPPVTVVDLREEIKAGNRSIFSGILQYKIKDRLDKGEQTILFLNRRGYATFVSCRHCGLVLTCPRCGIALTYHASIQQLTCHYCNYEKKPPRECPSCRSVYIRHFGTGTERVEAEVARLFPAARTIRVDVDTTAQRGIYEKMYHAFRRGDADILVGTQMIAKGLDFPNVTLVGVVSADPALNLPDFRAGERAFQLLTQVAGRAGRGRKPGEVIIQTYQPDHYSVVTAQSHDYAAFYAEEIRHRARWGYPPYRQLVRIVVSGFQEAMVRQGAELLGRYLTKYLPAEGCEVLGPAPAFLERIKNRWRWQIVLKGDSTAVMREIITKGTVDFEQNHQHRGLRLSIDVDPLGML